MAKIVFFCIPAHGHTNPTLGVVRELVRRGHSVWYYSYDAFREKIEAAGATFVSCQAHDSQLRLSPADSIRVVKDVGFSLQVLADSALAMEASLCAQLRSLQPDCIVGDSMALWARGIADKLHVPFVCSITTFAFNRYSARVMQSDLAGMFRMLLAMPRAKKQLKRLQAAGYPFRTVLDVISCDDSLPTVVYTSPQFQPCSETFSDKVHFVGPSVRPVEKPFAKPGTPLVYLSMGTVHDDLPAVYQACLEGLADSGCHLVVSAGACADKVRAMVLSPNVQVFERVDQMAVLQQADVFISHCGMNSVNESLYCGVPLVMLPQTSEQTGVANRVAQLHAGIRAEKATPTAILTAVQTILTDPSYRQNAAKLRESFLSCPGAAGAADVILAFCQKM